jgi:WS/DGAT/MGAT family acyltransferase
LVTVPLTLDRPYWVEDPDFDVEFHVRHIALPHPGDWRQLCIQVARLHSRPLDRSRPLWEVYVIEGLENIQGPPPGSFALYVKLHHALFDGEAATEITRALHSLAPDAPEEPDGSVHVRYADREPSPLELYSRALANGLTGVPRLARFMVGTAGHLTALGVRSALENQSRLRAGVGSLLKGDLTSVLPSAPPATRFSDSVSAHRVFEAVGLPMADIRTIRQQVPNATVNDVFMAVVGGALRRYLAAKGELPEASIVAGVPMTLRGADKSGDGNRISFTAMAVHSDIADPLARLEATRQSGEKSKRLIGGLGKDLMTNMLEALPAPLSEVLLRSVKMPKLSVIVSNVRGSDVPLYMAGARMVAHLPISIVLDGVALNCTGFSYDGTLWVSAVSCRRILPDPGFFADCLRSSFDDLKRAANDRAGIRPPAPLPSVPDLVVPRARNRRSAPRARAAGTSRTNGTAGSKRL